MRTKCLANDNDNNIDIDNDIDDNCALECAK